MVRPFFTSGPRDITNLPIPPSTVAIVHHPGLSSFLSVDSSATLHRLTDAGPAALNRCSGPIVAALASQAPCTSVTPLSAAVAPDEALAIICQADDAAHTHYAAIFKTDVEGLTLVTEVLTAVPCGASDTLGVSCAFSPSSRYLAVSVHGTVCNIEVALEPDPMARPSETTLAFKTHKSRRLVARLRSVDTIPLHKADVAWSSTGRYISIIADSTHLQSAVKDMTDDLSTRQDQTLPPVDLAGPTQPGTAGRVAIGLLERHLAPHEVVTLPQLYSGSSHVTGVVWAGEDRLAITVESAGVDNEAMLMMFVKANTLWHLDHSIPVPKGGVAVPGGDKWMFVTPDQLWQFTLRMTPIVSMTDLRTVAMVNGSQLKLTHLSRAMIPPPYCAETVIVDGLIEYIAFHPSEPSVGVVYYTPTGLHKVDFYHVTLTEVELTSSHPVPPGTLPVAFSCSTAGFVLVLVAPDGSQRHSMFTVTSTRTPTLTPAAIPSGQQLDGGEWRDVVTSIGPVSTDAPTTPVLSAFGFGAYEWVTGWRPLVAESALAPPGAVLLPCRPGEASVLATLNAGRLSVFDLHGQLSPSITFEGVSSMCASVDGSTLFAVQDTTLHVITAAPLVTIASRPIERSSSLIAAVGDAAILQHKRGNLETVYIAALVQGRVDSLVKAGEIQSAAALLRRHRLSLGRLLDFDQITPTLLTTKLRDDQLIQLAQDSATHPRVAALNDIIALTRDDPTRQAVAVECALQTQQHVVAATLSTDLPRLLKRVDAVVVYRDCLRAGILDLAEAIAQAAGWDMETYRPELTELAALQASPDPDLSGSIYNARMRMAVQEWPAALDQWAAVPTAKLSDYLPAVEQTIIRGGEPLILRGLELFGDQAELVGRVADAAVAKGLPDRALVQVLVTAGRPLAALPVLIRLGDWRRVLTACQATRTDPHPALTKAARVLINSSEPTDAARCIMCQVTEARRRHTHEVDPATIKQAVELFIEGSTPEEAQTAVLEAFGTDEGGRLVIEVVRPAIIQKADKDIAKLTAKMSSVGKVTKNIAKWRTMLAEADASGDDKRIFRAKKGLASAEEGVLRLQSLAVDSPLGHVLVELGEAGRAAGLERARLALRKALGDI